MYKNCTSGKINCQFEEKSREEVVSSPSKIPENTGGRTYGLLLRPKESLAEKGACVSLAAIHGTLHDEGLNARTLETYTDAEATAQERSPSVCLNQPIKATEILGYCSMY